MSKEVKWLHINSIKIVDINPINVRTMELAVKIWNHELSIEDSELPKGLVWKRTATRVQTYPHK